jgi:hypothetical protein
MNNDELNDLDAMTGLEGGGGQGMVLDLLSLNGDAEIVEVDGKYETKGGYYRLLKLTQAKKNEKPEEERLGDSVSVVFLKVRRALQQRAADGKLRLWTSEHSTADDTVELHSSETQRVLVGSARALRERFDGLRTVQYVYGLLMQGTNEPKLIKMRFKGSALGSEVKGNGVKTFYDYIYEDRKDAEGKKVHLRHLETVLSCAKENGKKTYFTVIFERGADLSPELCQIADDTLREVHKKITAVDGARDKRIVALQAQNKSGDVSLDDGMSGDESANDGVDDVNPDDIPF